MKHLLTAALIATAPASPVRGDGVWYHGANAEIVIREGEILSTGFDISSGAFIHYLLVEYDGRLLSCVHSRSPQVFTNCTDEYVRNVDRYDPNGGHGASQ